MEHLQSLPERHAAISSPLPARSMRPQQVRESHDLPPSARAQKSHSGQNRSGTARFNAAGVSRWITSHLKPIAITSLVVGALSIAGMFKTGDGSHRDRLHHEHATEHWEQALLADGKDQPLKWVTPSGPAKFVGEIPVNLVADGGDLDVETTREIRSLIADWRQQHGPWASFDSDLKNDVQRVLKEAQQDLAVVDADRAASLDEPPAEPSLTDGMLESVLNGDTGFFHIYLYDSCFEDGDIVDLVINGHRFATVPITNQGCTLTVPLNTAQATSIAVQGIFDGGGGITVACQTSHGQGFLRIMAPGEIQPLATTPTMTPTR